MSTNICSKKHTKYFTAKELSEELNCSVQQIYKILKREEIKTAVIKIGTAGIRINKEKFYEILNQIYRD